MTRPAFALRLTVRPLRTPVPVLSITLCALLAACGGGGDDPAAEAAATTAPTMAVAAAAAGGADTTAAAPADTAPVVVAAAAPSEASTFALPAPLPVDAADIGVEARPALTFAGQHWGNVQCVGQIRASQDVPETGMVGTPLAGGDALRFGRVFDPLNPTQPVYRFTLDVNDPPTASSQRCEVALSGGRGALPRDQVFWHAFAVLLSDQAGTTDEQAIAQWHAGDTSGLLPIYTLLQKGNQLRLVLRYDSAATPTRAGTTTVTVWRSVTSQAGRWLSFVTQAQLTPRQGGGGFVRTWLDGKRIVDYTGPVGYDQPTATPYVKHGIYHWVDSSNPWDLKLPTRTVLQRHPLVVLDPTRKYTEASLAAAVASL